MMSHYDPNAYQCECSVSVVTQLMEKKKAIPYFHPKIIRYFYPVYALVKLTTAILCLDCMYLHALINPAALDIHVRYEESWSCNNKVLTNV